jgi:hypothetical protein
MKLMLIGLALASAFSLDAQALEADSSGCTPIGIESFGNINMMQISPSSFTSLPCLATLHSIASMNGSGRGVSNYGNVGIGAARGVTNYGNIGIGAARLDPLTSEKPSVLSVYASELQSVSAANNNESHRSNFLAVKLRDEKTLQVALESIDNRLYVSAYMIDADWQERLLGRVLREQRSSGIYGIHMYRKHGSIESIAIVQDAAKTVWRIDQPATGQWEWSYGMLIGGTGDGISTNNQLPVKLYLNHGLRPWVE